MFLADLWAFSDTEVALTIGHSTNADGPFVRTLHAVCASWQTNVARLRLRAKVRMCALSSTLIPP